jgi:hypothetical protein
MQRCAWVSCCQAPASGRIRRARAIRARVSLALAERRAMGTRGLSACKPRCASAATTGTRHAASVFRTTPLVRALPVALVRLRRFVWRTRCAFGARTGTRRSVDVRPTRAWMLARTLGARSAALHPRTVTARCRNCAPCAPMRRVASRAPRVRTGCAKQARVRSAFANDRPLNPARACVCAGFRLCRARSPAARTGGAGQARMRGQASKNTCAYSSQRQCRSVQHSRITLLHLEMSMPRSTAMRRHRLHRRQAARSRANDRGSPSGTRRWRRSHAAAWVWCSASSTHSIEFERALKGVLVRDAARDALMVSAFEREFRVLSSLDHPRIIRVFGYGVADDALAKRWLCCAAET